MSANKKMVSVPLEAFQAARSAIRDAANQASRSLARVGKTLPEHYRTALQYDEKMWFDLLNEWDTLLEQQKDSTTNAGQG